MRHRTSTTSAALVALAVGLGAASPSSLERQQKPAALDAASIAPLLAAFPDRSPFRTAPYDPAYAAFVGSHLRAMGRTEALQQLETYLVEHDLATVGALAPQLFLTSPSPSPTWQCEGRIEFIGGLPYLLSDPRFHMSDGLGGGAWSALDHLHAWRTNGVERNPVCPPSEHPARDLVAYLERSGRLAGDAADSAAVDDATAFILAQQLARAVATAAPDVFVSLPRGDACTAPNRDATLEFLRHLDTLEIRWNASIGRYTRLDGSYEEQPTEFREARVWLVSFDGWTVRVLIERVTSRRVRVRFIVEPIAARQSENTIVRLRTDGESETLATLEAEATSFVLEKDIEVPPDTTLQLELDAGGEIRHVQHCP